ncbi:helix-turn-helix domain-containing protein [Ectobacillus funiculus]|uniref:Helix-turn-helix domain-containing protein n=1 Tax=Ectobacillus funiculus TaxID=137993 RepID=A0ABV5WLT1_9BACI
MLKRLADLRKSSNWSMQETADRLGIAKSTYAGYESGYREPPLHALCQMADLFDTTVDYILARSDHKIVQLELVSLLKTANESISLDQRLLTSEEIRDFIAFIRYKRDMNVHGMDKS